MASCGKGRQRSTMQDYFNFIVAMSKKYKNYHRGPVPFFDLNDANDLIEGIVGAVLTD
jgi:hypothetical protein